MSDDAQTQVQRRLVFKRVYPERIGLFFDGRCVADYRPSGLVWKVRQFFPLSSQVYRETLVSSERVAREVALEMAETMVDMGAHA